MNGKGAKSIYTNNSYFKWGVTGVSLIITVSSIFYTNILVNEIRSREIDQINFYAKTLEHLANSSINDSDYSFLLEDVASNKIIPVILTNEVNVPTEYHNIPMADQLQNPEKKAKFLRDRIQSMKNEYDPIEVELVDGEGNLYGLQYIYYENSSLLKRLQYYPYVQLSIILVFGFVIFFIFNYSRTTEQNQVWVGLAKETAHQLGTPLSSLIAWVEYLKNQYHQDQNIHELDKDIKRLEMITARFSSIGSNTHLKPENIFDVVWSSLSYLENRLSKKIKIKLSIFPNKNIKAQLNRDLFQWVMENICKNAVDAMEGRGDIYVHIMKINGGMIAIDIKDSGNGISKNYTKKIFKPGFTTKKRGWGLGLTLVKRIVENYHKGKIYIKNTEINKGTTFRILVNSY